MMEVARPRVGQNVDARCGDGAEKAFGLVAVGVEEAVDGGDNALDLEPFAPWDIEGSVLEDLDLEALKDPMVLAEALVPAIDAFALQPQALGIET